MNFGKHFNNVNNFIGHGYHHGKRFLGHLDNAYRTGAEIYFKQKMSLLYNKWRQRQPDMQIDTLIS